MRYDRATLEGFSDGSIQVTRSEHEIDKSYSKVVGLAKPTRTERNPKQEYHRRRRVQRRVWYLKLLGHEG